MRISDWSSDVCSSDLFYQDTGARKWGRPYLTRACFSLLVERMADRMLLILALREGRAIAGALNMIGPQTLYGRYWGCVEDVPFLHFELCYYQAIDFAIARGLQTVEAGAQGEHKLARGYAPVPTWRSEEPTSELQSLMRISYAVFCLKKKKTKKK